MKKAKQIPTQFRQGDVLVIAVDSIPGKTKPIPREAGRIVLAHGEVTGHSHAIAARSAHFLMATEPSSGGRAEVVRRYLEAQTGVVLKHEEHAPIKLPAGRYEVRIQKEYSPEAIRNVAD